VIDETVPSRDGTPIRYLSDGSGDLSILFLHGWLGNAHWWDASLARLASRARVVALDLAGHGRSGRRAGWTIPGFGDDVVSVVERLSLRRIVLVSHSMSIYVALEAAPRIDAAAIVPVDTLHDAEWTAPEGFTTGFLAPFRKDFPKAVRRLFGDLGAGPKSSREALARILAEAAVADPAVAIPILAAVLDYEPRGPLSRIRVPIRAINSARRPTRLESNRKYAPDFQAVALPGVGHWPMLEAPEKFGDLLEGVLKELEAPKA